MKTKYDVYKIPSSGENKDKDYYCARLIPSGTIKTSDLARKIEYATTLTMGDIQNVLSCLKHEMETSLKAGKRIHLEGLGYFQMKITSDLVEDPKKMRAEHVRFKSIAFRPEKRLKDAFNDTDFVRTKEKKHSQKHTEKGVEKKLKEYFRNHSFITRAEFQELCGYTKNMALTKLNTMIKEGKLKKEGIQRFPVYSPVH